MRIRVLSLALSALLAVALTLAIVGTITADEANRAGLVVTFPDHTETFWIEFSEEDISGVELLERSGLDVTFSSNGGLGDAVCAIEDIGCSNPGDCFCQCKSGNCSYWVYFRLEDSEWRNSPLGASSRKLRDGDVDGWVWGSGAPPAEMLTPVPCPTPTAQPTATEPAQPAGPPQASSPSTQPAGTDTPTSSSPTGGSPHTPTLASATRSSVAATNLRTPTSPGTTIAGDDGGSDSGLPAGLIAFGVVAGIMLSAGGGALYVRRKKSG